MGIPTTSDMRTLVVALFTIASLAGCASHSRHGKPAVVVPREMDDHRATAAPEPVAAPGAADVVGVRGDAVTGVRDGGAIWLAVRVVNRGPSPVTVCRRPVPAGRPYAYYAGGGTVLVCDALVVVPAHRKVEVPPLVEVEPLPVGGEMLVEVNLSAIGRELTAHGSLWVGDADEEREAGVRRRCAASCSCRATGRPTNSCRRPRPACSAPDPPPAR